MNQKQLEIVLEGISPKQVQEAVERKTKGWWLYFEEPSGVNYEFLSPFWGYHWDGTPEDLKKIIIRGATVKGHTKHHICVFKYNGEDMFAWCSWTKEVYDFHTKIKHQLEGKQLAAKITGLIEDILEDKDCSEQNY